MFTRKHQYNFSIPKEHLKHHLIGHHVKIHDKDFQLMEDDQELSILPNEEQISKTSTLPVTQVELRENGNKTEVVITSKMRDIDSGGPLVVVLFSIFFFVASFILLAVGKDPVVTLTLCGISLLVFIIFLVRMQIGYFDYVRKIRHHFKDTGDQITVDVRRKLFKHKLK